MVMQADGNFCLYQNGSASCRWQTNTPTPSDIRLKQNVRPLSHTLEKLQCLSGIRFTWKNEEEFGVGDQIGVIAQEVEAVFPELVSTVNDRKLVNYQSLIPVLIEAVKEQQAILVQMREDVRQRMGQEMR